MFTAAKQHASEVDTKLRIYRKKTANFACGYVQQDASKIEPARQFIATSRDGLTEIESQCLDFARGTEQLERCMLEADDTADKVFARLSELYAECGLDMPTVEDEELPVGIPLEKLSIQEEPEEPVEDEQPSDAASSLVSPGDGSDEGDEAYQPKIFISRPSDSGGPVTFTPMIKARKKIL